VSDTFFSAAPEWSWLVVLYFFFGGIAGGSYVIAALIDLFGAEEDRLLARLGYLIAFPAVVLCGPLLIVDLERPERFWHMLLQSERLLPIAKLWSPMSVGSWMLIELVALAGVVLSLGEVARVWLSAWGLALVVGVVLVGILLPLLLHWRPRLLGGASLPTAAVLALVGGLILRAVVVLSSETV
jgi:formate-dependent nitrite reductase membrane component NrfD